MSTAPACIGPHPNPRKPRHQLPAGSTDCHCHVFEDPKKYPLSENRSYTPPYLPLERFQHEGMVPAGGTSQQLMDLIRREIDVWHKVVVRAGIRVE